MLTLEGLQCSLRTWITVKHSPSRIWKISWLSKRIWKRLSKLGSQSAQATTLTRRPVARRRQEGSLTHILTSSPRGQQTNLMGITVMSHLTRLCHPINFLTTSMRLRFMVGKIMWTTKVIILWAVKEIRSSERSLKYCNRRIYTSQRLRSTLFTITSSMSTAMSWGTLLECITTMLVGC